MKNKISIYYILVMLFISPFISAKTISPITLDSLSFDRNGDYMKVGMDIDLTSVNVTSTCAQTITPLIVSSKGDTVQMQSIGIYGKSRYINYQRNGKVLSNGYEKSFVKSECPDIYNYMNLVKYEDWMNDTQLLIRRRLYGCSNCIIDEKIDTISQYIEITPPEIPITYFNPIEIKPIIETKEGSAYIEFIVNKTDINPEYRHNNTELSKIRTSIDSVLNDTDVTITGIWLKGFASPESPYSHNSELAHGRTESLKKYIIQQYGLNPDMITVEFEPEDWEGFRVAVQSSFLENRDDILNIIDSDNDPDYKEKIIKSKYPRDYKYILDYIFPSLRHTEYRISYQIKQTDNVDKIRELMQTNPNRLTQREFHILANASEPGSVEYFNIFETAARMYPHDNIASINTACAAIQRKDYETANKYLLNSGNSDEAQYMRAVLAYYIGDYDISKQLLYSIQNNQNAQKLIKIIENLQIYQNQKRQNRKIILK